jgi:Glycosyltransferase sugar-binding region containing DXD motif
MYNGYIVATPTDSMKQSDQQYKRWIKMRARITLFIFIWVLFCGNAISCYWYTFSSFVTWSRTITEAMQQQQSIEREEWNANINYESALAQLNFTSNNLLWFVPRPPSPRFLGWEDIFMRQFKEIHYTTSENSSDLACYVDEENNPYPNIYVCEVPGYIPARMPLPPSSQRIPRVIFVSWYTRKLHVMQFISIMSILAHNPEYELIFMVDHEIDRYVCANYPEYVSEFSRLKSGAARVDVWRMMVMYQYGGVYLDFDNTAVGHIPIQGNDTIVTSVRNDFTHSRKNIFGILEHWAFAIAPKSLLVNRTLDIIKQNIKDPSRIDDPFLKKQVESETMRLTGPVPFQEALHELLHEAECEKEHNHRQTYFPALKHPARWCNMTKFTSFFGSFRSVQNDFGKSMLMKTVIRDEIGFVIQKQHYDGAPVLLPQPPANFCTNESFARTTALHEIEWNESVMKKKSMEK